jgi:predicted exporter
MTVRGRWLAGIWMAFVAACALIISRTEFNTDMSAFLPRSPTPTQKILVDQLRDGVVSRLILVGIEGATPDALARISREMAARLREEKSLASVNNGERGGQQQDFDLLWRNRYVLSAAVTPQHFSASGLRDSLLGDLDLLASPMGSLVQRVLPDDPGGELIGLLDQLEGQAKPALHGGVWFSRDGSRAMLLVQTRAAGSDLDAQESAMQAILRAFDAVRKDTADARLRMTGPGVFSVQSRAAIRDDAMRFSLIATLLISSLLLLLYRSPRVLVLGLLPVASGALAGVAAVSLGFGSVHGITLGFGVTLIGEGVDYAIYLFTQIAPQTSARSTLQRIWPTLRLGVLTSICGFSAMLLSGFTGLAQLGMFSITGLIVAVTVTRWLLPELLPPGFYVHSGERLTSAVMSFMRVAPHARIPLLAAAVALLLFLMVHRDALWNDNLASLSPVPKELQVLDEQLRRDLGAPDVRYMIVAVADDQQAALQRSEEISFRLNELVQRGVLQGFNSPSQILPSLRTQEARRAALPDSAALRADIGRAQHGLPFRPGLFEPFLQDVAAARRQPLLEYSSLQGSSLGLQLDSLLVKRAEGWMVMLPLRGVSDVAPLAQVIGQDPGASAMLLDMKQETEQMFREYRHEAAKYAALGALAIIVLLSISLHSPRRVLDVSLPLAAAVIAVTAGLVWSGHALTLFHLIGLLLVVAIGSNYSLFFDRLAVSGQDKERTATSLLFANISTIIGFGLLSFSQAPVLSAIGSTVGLGAALSLVFSAILIKKGEA